LAHLLKELHWSEKGEKDVKLNNAKKAVRKTGKMLLFK